MLPSVQRSAPAASSLRVDQRQLGHHGQLKGRHHPGHRSIAQQLWRCGYRRRRSQRFRRTLCGGVNFSCARAQKLAYDHGKQAGRQHCGDQHTTRVVPPRRRRHRGGRGARQCRQRCSCREGYGSTGDRRRAALRAKHGGRLLGPDRAQRGSDRGHVRWALCRVFGHHAHDQRVKLGRHRRVDVAQRRWRLAQVAVHNLLHGTLEREPADGHLVHQHPELIHIRARIQVAAVDLLGR